ncbi:hypothetical protein U9Z31_23350 [Escherichia coli]|nr:hypothetical protein [Escherichia coli]HCJ9689893.1 hypothetical protein [Escherichia coli]
MKHVFEYLDHAEDREHAEAVATKEIELTHLEKYTIRALADAANYCGSLEIVQPSQIKPVTTNENMNYRKN